MPAQLPAACGTSSSLAALRVWSRRTTTSNRLALPYVTVTNQNLADDAAFQMLNRLAVALDLRCLPGATTALSIRANPAHTQRMKNVPSIRV